MNAEDLLTQERRARMAAEQLLAQKQDELNEANRRLSHHAISLTEDLVEKREEVEEVRGENSRVRADLVRATEEVSIAKQRLWDSIQSIEDGFAVFDSDHRMVIANEAYLRPFDGLECIRPGVHYEEIIEALVSEGIVNLQGVGRSLWRETMLTRWYSPLPEPREIKLWDGAWLRLQDQRTTGGDTVCLGLNITETMRRERALKEATERAEAANRAKSAFLANMSHEIRTPMNGVIAMADLMAEGELDDEQKLYIDTIRDSGQALLTIINDVLDYSKIEAKKLHLQSEPFDLEKTVLDVIQLLQPELKNKGLKLIFDHDMFLPTTFRGDPVRLRQIITNLMGNAVKFTEKGHILIRIVGLPAQEEGHQQLHFTIEDTGIGIPTDKLEHVFGKFNQVEDERNRSYDGTGLGLAITRQLVELMGGTIWVDSEVDVGSSFGFRITLPIVDPVETPTIPDWQKTALIIMDDDLNRIILQKRLLALGLKVTMVASTEQATALTDPQFDMIFADQELPEPLTASAIEDLRTHHINAPILMLSAPSNIHATVPGIAKRLLKPTPRPALIEALNNLPEPAPALAPMPAPMPAPMFGSRRTPQEPEAPQPAKDTPRKMRVLCAEDNKTNQLVFSKFVKNCDIDLKFAGNGQEAVELFESFQPDLIFMDISMPVMDGKEATRTIRALEADKGLPRTRIVAVTAHAMTGDGEEIMSHGLDNHLTKPLKKPALFKELTDHCPEGATPAVPE
ncbi:MAG: hybrid sensor histidine kinase/response regulator [Rhodobacterales bacterium]|nr:MAG: hybrid sensor histidine kinase/response regulator [Rhodobacterales bacterium]